MINMNSNKNREYLHVYNLLLTTTKNIKCLFYNDYYIIYKNLRTYMTIISIRKSSEKCQQLNTIKYHV